MEVGGGYFNTFGPDDNRILEVYVGYGGGSTDRTYRRYDDNDVLTGTDLEEATFNKTFLQVNYSSKKSNNLKLFGEGISDQLWYGTADQLGGNENFYDQRRWSDA